MLNILINETTSEGKIKTKSSIRVDGSHAGSIESGGDVAVGKDGIVFGDVFAVNATVEGIIRGTVFIEGNLQILGTGKIFGYVSYSSIEMEKGSAFVGNASLNKVGQAALEAEEKRKSEELLRKEKALAEQSKYFQTLNEEE